METILYDLRFALRTLRRRLGFTLVAVLTLALGIGANTAIFSVVNSLLFRPLPVTDADALVSLAVSRPGLSLGGQEIPIGVSYPDYRDYRDMEAVFADAVAATTDLVQMCGAPNATRQSAAPPCHGSRNAVSASPSAHHACSRRIPRS